MSKNSKSIRETLTNEEIKTKIYLTSVKPTEPSTVNEYTPIESLNLNWSERDLPESHRTKHVHRLHPYLGKFIPQLVEIFLRKYFKEGDIVLDPFCGSGTTLVQAKEMGISSIGYDISAFNVLLSKVKTFNYENKRVKFEVFDILEKTRNMIKDETTIFKKDQNIHLPASNSDYLDNWFAPKALLELLTYRYYIETGDYEYKDLLKIILTRAARSARLVKHYDLDFPKNPQITPYYCKKHGRQCKPTQEAFKFIYRYSVDTVRRIVEFNRVNKVNAKVEVHQGDSRKIEFPQIDGIITSPPYVGLIDYHQQHIYAYHLLGLKDVRKKEIGAAINGSNSKAINEYKKDLIQVFTNAAKSMKPQGRMIIVAGDSYNLYDEIAQKSGLITENIINRHVNRRTGRRTSEFFESVFIWKKP